jgi:hypothetical protein
MHRMQLLGDVGHVDIVCWEIVLILTQDRCTDWAEHTIGLEKYFWTHRMELLGDVGHVESRSALFGDSVSVGARQVHGLRQTYHRLRNPFGGTRWYSVVRRLNQKHDSVCLEIVLILIEDRCTVCAERTPGSEIILDAPDQTPR